MWLFIIALLPVGVYTLPFHPNGLLFTKRATANGGSAIDQSSDVWASVVANVAPLMALIGEKNAKEYMRVASSRTQLLVMAVAPVGILSIVVSAVRLSGPRLLRRLLGRESDRRSEAMVELTPLSVDPATSAYTPSAVEVEPMFNRDRAAFVCSHIGNTTRVDDSITAFKQLMLERNGKADPVNGDYELILALRNVELTVEESARLVTSIISKDSPIDLSLAARILSSSISFRTVGISPTQTMTQGKTLPDIFKKSLQYAVSLIFASTMVGLQYLGYYTTTIQGDTQRQSLILGTCGYLGVVLFTYALLILVREEVEIMPQTLPAIFHGAVWSFSDSRHAEHQAINMPPNGTLVVACTRQFTRAESRRREAMTSILCSGLVGAYVTYYLGIRVAPWWVGFSHVGVIWLAAAYRAGTIHNILVSSHLDLGEHWLGVCRDTLYDSILETTRILEDKTLTSKTLSAPQSSHDISALSPDVNHTTTSEGTYLLLSVKPTRQSLRNWSGCEDVMKVSLELARRACLTKSCDLSYVRLREPPYDSITGHKLTTWKGLFRFQLVIYVPGLVWRSRRSIDYILEEQDLQIPNIYRDILKLLHLCWDFVGDISTHGVPEIERSQISELVRGPVTVPDKAKVPRHASLSELLVLLRDTNAPITSNSKAYVLEHSFLVPSMQLAVMYEVTRKAADSDIAKFQNQHVDKLPVGGHGRWLHVLEERLDREDIWAKIMKHKTEGEMRQQDRPRARDGTSGHYGKGIGNSQENAWLNASTAQADASSVMRSFSDL